MPGQSAAELLGPLAAFLPDLDLDQLTRPPSELVELARDMREVVRVVHELQVAADELRNELAPVLALVEQAAPLLDSLPKRITKRAR